MLFGRDPRLETLGAHIYMRRTKSVRVVVDRRYLLRNLLETAAVASFVVVVVYTVLCIWLLILFLRVRTSA